MTKASGIAIFGVSRRLGGIFLSPARAQRCLVAKTLNKASDARARGVCEVFQQSAVTFPDESRVEDGGGSERGTGRIVSETRQNSPVRTCTRLAFMSGGAF